MGRFGFIGIILCCWALPIFEPLATHAESPAAIAPAEPAGDHTCKPRKLPLDPATGTSYSVPYTLVLTTITADGTTKDIVVLKSSGFPEMDAVAIGCVVGFRYRPATLNGRPVETKTKVQLNWMTGTPVSPSQWPGMDEVRQGLEHDTTEGGASNLK